MTSGPLSNRSADRHSIPSPSGNSKLGAASPTFTACSAIPEQVSSSMALSTVTSRSAGTNERSLAVSSSSCAERDNPENLPRRHRDTEKTENQIKPSWDSSENSRQNYPFTKLPIYQFFYIPGNFIPASFLP